MSLTIPTVTTLSTELADELGEDSSDTAVMARIVRWINDTFEDVLSRCTDWKWTRDYKELVIGTPYSTGTVTVTNGSTTVTGSGTTFTTSWKNRIFWISGNSVTYKVASVDSATQLTLESAYQETTAAGASYYLVQNRYPIDNQAYEAGIVELINPYSDLPLEELDMPTFLRNYPCLQVFGTPTAYAVWGQEDPANTNGVGPMIYFNAFPTTARLFPYFFHKQFDRLATTQKFPIPMKFNRRVLMLGSKILSGRFDNESKSELMMEYEKTIAMMLRENSKSGKRKRYFRETDVPSSQGDSARLPSSYPRIGDL